jgi:hypothetical protein
MLYLGEFIPFFTPKYKLVGMLAFVVFLLRSTSLEAHPVIWKGGTVASMMSFDTMSDITVHRSVTSRSSLGFHGLFMDSANRLMLQSNALIKRWNSLGMQANVYGFTGVGMTLQSSKTFGLGHLGLAADWETRRFHLFSKYDGYIGESLLHVFRGRAGMAPYIGGYNDIHTWVMIQLTSMHQNKATSTHLLPLIRFFKHNFLVELGTNFSNRYIITAMMHF